MSTSNGPSTPEQHYHQALSDDHARRTIRTIPELKRESSREVLAAVQLLNVLDIDDRPSFAIRVQPALASDLDAPLDLVYCNTAFTNTAGLSAKVTGQLDSASIFAEHGQPQQAFRKWLRDVVDETDFSRRGNAYMFEGLIWTAVTIEDHKIISGLHASLLWPDVAPGTHMESVLGQPRTMRMSKSLSDQITDQSQLTRGMPVQGRAPTVPPAPSPRDNPGEELLVSLPGTKFGPYDVTLPDAPESILNDHVKHFRGVDWVNTPLGAMSGWPPELRNVVNMCLNDIHPCMLLWGENVTMLYNAAYVQLIGAMHPTALGKSARVVASEYWHTFQPLVDHINNTGQSVCDNEVPIFVNRHGFLEETYWSFQFIPVLDSNGHVAGYYHPLFETTKYVTHH
jgi:hypothetical protein